jgi:hypothetical protein
MILSNRPEPLKLLPYQETAVEYGKKTNSIFLLMGTGLGKTITTLHILKSRQLTRILCVVPKTIIENWAKEIRRCQDFSYSIAIGNKLKRIEALNLKVSITLINFEGIRLLRKEIREILFRNNYDGLVIDELARVRRYSQQTKALKEISKNFKVRIGLSGLLLSENLTDVFNPFAIIDQGKAFGTDWFRFREKHFEQIDDGSGFFKWQPTEYGKKIIPALVKKYAYIVNAEDVGTLPPVSFVTRKISLSEEQNAFLKILEEEWKSTYSVLGEKKEEFHDYTIQIIQRAHQCISGFIYKEDKSVYWFNYNPKIQELNAIIEELGITPFIVWCQYKAEQAMITSLLESLGKRICPNDRLIDFDTNNSYDCCVCSFSRDSQGHNLKKANTAIFFSRPLSYEKFHQALGRNRRLGSDCKIISYQVISSRHKIELINDTALRKKKDLSNLIREMKVEEIWMN